MIKNESVRRARSRDWRVKFLAGHDSILAGDFLFTGHYFELLVLLAYCDLPIANRIVSNVS